MKSHQPDSDLHNAIAIIGMCGRFPGSPDLDSFWSHILAGRELITELTDSELEQNGVPSSLYNRDQYVRRMPQLGGIKEFDARFFGYSPREAELMDPQHRLFLESAWQLLEVSGYAGESEKRIGILAGSSMSTYLLHNLIPALGLDLASEDGRVRTGNDKDFLAGRVAYKCNLKGPAATINTACSTSLVAIWKACEELLQGNADMMLAGGVSISVPEGVGYLYQEGGIASPDGRCRPFDEQGKGTIGGNGLGIVLLKTLDHAIADGDTIHAVIRGGAVNNDGSDKIGFTAPSVDGQIDVIRQSLTNSGVSPDSVGYIETHGTGTSLGDPIELEALQAVYGSSTSDSRSVSLGSVKANIGHLDAASGVAGLIKAALVLQHKTIPPLVNFTKPNAHFDFAKSPFRLSSDTIRWETPPEKRRRAAVSSFGIGGTNAHIILEEAPSAESSPEESPAVCTLSARSGPGLDELRKSLAEKLHNNPELNLRDVCYTLQTTRTAYPWRFSFAADSIRDAIKSLEEADGVTNHLTSEQPVKTAFAFPGQGSQYAGMGRELYRRDREFKEDIDRCADILRNYTGTEMDLTDLLFNRDHPSETLRQTGITQPLVFVISWAVARWWLRRGVQPEVLIGHSLGEYTAACLAGVFSLEDGLKLVLKRGELMQALPEGDMLALFVNEEQALELTNRYNVSLAAVNGPGQCVLSGRSESIHELSVYCKEAGIAAANLETSHAFHSTMMDDMIEEYRETASGITYHPPKIPVISNCTGRIAEPGLLTNVEYWVAHVRKPVLFSRGVEEILSTDCTVVIETGPGETLSKLAHRIDARLQPVISLKNGAADEYQLLHSSLGHAWVYGVNIDWSKHDRIPGRKVALPPTPMNREEYWIDPPGSQPSSAPTTDPEPSRRGPETFKEKDLNRWFYYPEWKRLPLSGGEDKSSPKQVLIIGESGGFSDRILNIHTDAGDKVEFCELIDGETAAPGKIRIGRPADYDRVLTPLLESADRLLYIAPEGDKNELTALTCQLYLAQTVSAFRQEPIPFTSITLRGVSVTGKETGIDAHAGIAGSLRVLEQEHPTLHCRMIDLESPESVETPAFRQELQSESGAFLVAIRGRNRWVQEYRRLEESEVPSRPAPLKKRGTYLITGGFGNVGNLLAGYLSKYWKANLVLTGRSPLLGEDDINAWKEGQLTEHLAEVVLPHALSFDFKEETAELRSRMEELLAESRQIERNDEDRLNRLASLLCGRLIFEELNRFLGDQNRFDSPDELKRALGVDPRFDRYFSYISGMLQEDGYLTHQEGKWELRSVDRLPGAGELMEEIRSDFPSLAGEIDLLRRCTSGFIDVISGRENGVSLIFDRQEETAGSSGDQEADSRIYFKTWSTLLRDLIQRMIVQQPDRKIRILEVGGGTGNLTRYLTEGLENENVEYLFTDIGHSFIRNAERHWRGASRNFMKFQAFDITRDPAEQGLDLFSFDLVVGLNVVHATPDLSQTTSHLKSLLRPGGLLGLIETVESERLDNLIWGLTPEWWSFTDTERRKETPLLPAEQWQELFTELQFSDVAALPITKDELTGCDSALILGRQPEDLLSAGDPLFRAGLETKIHYHQKRRERFDRLTLAPDAGTVTAEQADVSDRNAMASVIERARKRFGKIDGVIHAAGVVSGDSIFTLSHQTTGQDLHTQCKPKIDGLRNLQDLLSDQPPDFTLLLSSNASVIGGLGLVAYAAANSFMDAFANSADVQIPCISSNWDGWPNEDVETAPDEGPRSSISFFSMTLPEAEEVFQRVIGLQEISGQISVSAGPLESRLKKWGQTENREDIRVEPGSESGALKNGTNRPTVQSDYAAPETDTQERLAKIWEKLLGIRPVGIRDNFFELYGDSLLGTQLISRANQEFQVHLPLSSLFEDLTIESMARRIQKMQPSFPLDLQQMPEEEFEEGEL